MAMLSGSYKMRISANTDPNIPAFPTCAIDSANTDGGLLADSDDFQPTSSPSVWSPESLSMATVQIDDMQRWMRQNLTMGPAKLE